MFEQSSFSIIESGRSIYPSELHIIQTNTDEQSTTEDSIAILNQLDIDLQNEYYWYEMGLNPALNYDLSKAEDTFIIVFEYPCHPYTKELASLALSNICRRAKRIDTAILWAEIAYDLSKDKTFSLQALANAHLLNQNTDKAKKYFKELDEVIHNDQYKYYFTTFPQVDINSGLEYIPKIEISNFQ